MLPIQRTPANNPLKLHPHKLDSCASATFFAVNSVCVALQIPEQFCAKARTRQPITEPETDFNTIWPFNP